MRAVGFLWVLLLCWLPVNAAAQRLGPTDPSAIPEELREWIPWVMSDKHQELCVKVNGVPECVWPGRLELELEESRGLFRLDVFLSAEGWVILPGGRGAWPQEVHSGPDALAVVERDGAPAVLLSSGAYRLEGRFSWSELPETLAVGPHTALIDVSLEGTATPLVKRQEGRIWLKGLGKGAELADGPEQVELEVFRRIIDGVPMVVETRFHFQVAGRARELTLPNPLLADTRPMTVDGDLALALEDDGSLRVQLVPGDHSVTVTARVLGAVEALELKDRPSPWPEREIWVWNPAPQLRSVEVSGLPSIDPSRTSLPEDWRGAGAYLAEPGARLRLETTRRGQVQVPPNRLSLVRELWLDQDADAFTIRDSLSGEMNHEWRLSLQQGRLGQVQVDGQPQVITLGREDRPGVEVRDANLELSAISRLKRTTSLPAVSWSEDVESLVATLHLPPGWDVFAAGGVDTMAHTWVSRWDLFGVFYVLVLALAAARLCGRRVGAVALATLVLCHGVSDAPQYIWLVLVTLLALAQFTRGRWRRLFSVSFAVVGLGLSVLIVAFSVGQVRHALYPHLDTFLPDAMNFAVDGAGNFAADEAGEKKPMQVQAPPPREDSPAPNVAEEADALGLQEEPLRMPRREGRLVEGDQTSDKLQSYNRKAQGFSLGYGASGGSPKFAVQKQMAPDAVVQTGPGVPEGAARSWSLEWSGPVARDHRIRLWLISPGTMRVLTVLRVLSVLALAWLLFRAWRNLGPDDGAPLDLKKTPGRRNRRRGDRRAAAARVALPIAAALVTLLSARPGAAEGPTSERLSELQGRLMRSPECEPNCVSVSRLRVTAKEELEFRAEVHAVAPGAYRLPGQMQLLTAVRVSVDGKPSSALRLGGDGVYSLRVQPGVHDVLIVGQVSGNRATLDLGTPPQRVEVDAEGWVVTGVNDQGVAEGGTLTFVREVPRTDSAEAKGRESERQVAVPPFFRVERRIILSVNGQVRTRIERLSDPSQPELLRLPLLEGERVTTPGIATSQGVAEISFPRELQVVELTSTLSLPGDEPLGLDLLAPEAAPFTEVWLVECGIVWNCSSEGLTPVSRVESGRALQEFRPWPGESLQISAFRPDAAPGQSVTVKSATLTLTPGVRMSQGKLEMVIETSRSLVHEIHIPKQAKLERVTVDGTNQPVKSDQGRVRVSLGPSSHVVALEWQTSDGIGAMFRTPEVKTGAPGVNFRTVVNLPEGRWLLLAGGPRRGPAVLFWGYLLLILGAAMLLPRVPYNPLTTGQWFLLGLGLTQVPAVVPVFVALWFFTVGSRPRWVDASYWVRTLGQLGLIGYTVLFLVALTAAVYTGLVTSPDMEVEGSGSYSGHLVWFVDRNPGTFASAWVLSVSVWFWRAFMLAWALWLSWSLLRWLRWGWENSQVGGFWPPKPARGSLAGGAAGAAGAGAAAPPQAGVMPEESRGVAADSSDAEAPFESDESNQESSDSGPRGTGGEQVAQGELGEGAGPADSQDATATSSPTSDPDDESK